MSDRATALLSFPGLPLVGRPAQRSEVPRRRAVADPLERQLRTAALKAEPIAIGAVAAPYQPERHREATRPLLEACRRVEGLEISITTESPLVLRDLDLLVELDQRHAVTVDLIVTTVDSDLARRIDRHAPDPGARLAAVERIAELGIAANVVCAPVMPGINDGERVLRPLFEEAWHAGARDVLASALDLSPATRVRFLPWLALEFPELIERYRRFYGRRERLAERDGDRLLTTYRRLRLEYGFPRALPGRG